MLQLGDIVTVKGNRYTVVAFTGNASGNRDVVLAGKFHIEGTGTSQHQRTVAEFGLVADQRPLFGVGLAIQVGDRNAIVTADDGGPTVRVHMLVAEKDIGNDIKVEVESALNQDVPRWKVVLDNVL